MSLPVVAIIGRPNVGKSTIVNRLAGVTDSIVHDEPGVTRDRTYREAFWRDRDFLVVDTGGLVFDDDTEFLPLIREQAMLALAEANAAIMVVDGRVGPTGADETIASWLRQQSVPVLLAVNKCESPDQGIMQAAEFWGLGIGEPFPVSGIHGNGTGELLDQLVGFLPETDILEESDEIKVAIVGRPNVGKSSLLNAFVGENRAIVSPISGTTRDTIDMVVELEGQKFRIVDTAGIRKKKQVEYGPEFFGINRAFKAIRRSSVVLLVIDALDGVTEQDQKLAGRIEDDGRGCIIVVNKWDAIEKNNQTMEEYTTKIQRELNFMDYVPILFISAKTGQRMDQVLPMALRVQEERLARLTTSTINEIIHSAQDAHPHPTHAGRALKMFYGTQVRSDPPTFLIYVNEPKLMHFTYIRYLENQIRKEYGFLGTPIRIVTKGRRE